VSGQLFCAITDFTDELPHCSGAINLRKIKRGFFVGHLVLPDFLIRTFPECNSFFIFSFCAPESGETLLSRYLTCFLDGFLGMALLVC
jgi:hypothetical protein